MSQSKPSCKLISSTGSYHGKQGFDYQSAISAETVGAKALCMHMLTIPPGARANAHMHENHETSIYVLSGEGAMWYGDNLEEHMVAKAGDFIYIPAGVPHLPYNPSETEPVIAVLARTDPNEQESVVLLPQLDNLR
ncbi:MAG: cupin domain-containing protein [Trueperaceae bacterium]|nr:cupin domain-containing protein [Trueperaceae bacterium]